VVTRRTAEGWHGWDTYAPFYDWENARTLGRADVPFWTRFAGRIDGDLLELGSGTGRLLFPMARARESSGYRTIGLDRSEAMLMRASKRAQRVAWPRRPLLIRGDVRAWPLRRTRLRAVVAGYGLLQSLVNDRDFEATLRATAEGLVKGGWFGIDLVPDLTAWDEYEQQIPHRGRFGANASLTLVESVKQDRKRGLTMFTEQFVLRRGRQVERHAFTLTFRTLPMAQVLARLDRAGLEVDQVCGGYRGEVWHPEAETWLILARKR
jgi:SAM-dependent methyltransferase